MEPIIKEAQKLLKEALAVRPTNPRKAKKLVAQAAGANAILPFWAYCDQETVDKAHAAGLSVHPWATSEPRVIERLIAMGVDSICSNHPDVVGEALQREQAVDEVS
jgi:glycerophosphoryl diester phosphodiesterase